MGCCEILKSMYGSSGLRQMVLTIFPMAAMICLIIYANTLNTHEKTDSVEKLVTVSDSTVAANVRRFIKQSQQHTGIVRDMVYRGVWSDPHDITSIIQYVLPVMETQETFTAMSGSSNDGSEFIALRVDDPTQLGGPTTEPHLYLSISDPTGRADRIIRRYNTSGGLWSEWLPVQLCASVHNKTCAATYPLDATTAGGGLISRQRWWQGTFVPADNNVAISAIGPNEYTAADVQWHSSLSFAARGSAASSLWSENLGSMGRVVIRESALKESITIVGTASAAVLDDTGRIVMCSLDATLAGKPRTSLPFPLNRFNSINIASLPLYGTNASTEISRVNVPGSAGAWFVITDNLYHFSAAGAFTAFAKSAAMGSVAAVDLVRTGILFDSQDIANTIKKLIPLYLSKQHTVESLTLCDQQASICIEIHDAFSQDGSLVSGAIDVEIRQEVLSRALIQRWYPLGNNVTSSRFKWKPASSRISHIDLLPQEATALPNNVSLTLRNLNGQYAPPISGPWLPFNTKVPWGDKIKGLLGFRYCFEWPHASHFKNQLIPEGTADALMSCQQNIVSSSTLAQVLIDMGLHHTEGGAVVVSGDGRVLAYSSAWDVGPDVKIWDMSLTINLNGGTSATSKTPMAAWVKNEANFQAMVLTGKLYADGDSYILAEEVYATSDIFENPGGIGGPRFGPDRFYVLTWVREKIGQDTTITKTVYALDGLVILTLVLLCLHAVHYFFHIQSFVSVSDVVIKISDMELESIDAAKISRNLHWNYDIRSMQRSALKLYYSMGQLKQLMGPAAQHDWNPSAHRPAANTEVKTAESKKVQRQLGLHRTEMIVVSVMLPPLDTLRSSGTGTALIAKITEILGKNSGGMALPPAAKVIEGPTGADEERFVLTGVWDATGHTKGVRSVLAWRAASTCWEAIMKPPTASNGAAPPTLPPRDSTTVDVSDVEMREVEPAPAAGASGPMVASVAIAGGETHIGLLGDRHDRHFTLSGKTRHIVESLHAFGSTVLDSAVADSGAPLPIRVLADGDTAEAVEAQMKNPKKMSYSVGQIRSAGRTSAVHRVVTSGSLHECLQPAETVLAGIKSGKVDEATADAGHVASAARSQDPGLWARLDEALEDGNASAVTLQQ